VGAGLAFWRLRSGRQDLRPCPEQGAPGRAAMTGDVAMREFIHQWHAAPCRPFKTIWKAGSDRGPSFHMCETRTVKGRSRNRSRPPLGGGAGAEPLRGFPYHWEGERQHDTDTREIIGEAFAGIVVGFARRAALAATRGLLTRARSRSASAPEGSGKGRGRYPPRGKRAGRSRRERLYRPERRFISSRRWLMGKIPGVGRRALGFHT